MTSLRDGLLGGGGGNFLAGLFGAGGGIGADPWAGLRVATAHSGWTVGSGRAPGSRVVNPGVFAGAQRFHSGLKNDEFAAILQDGERVLTADQTTQAMDVVGAIAKGGGGGNTEVNIYNSSGAPVQERRRSSGDTEIVDIIIGAVNKGISQGRMDKTMGRFGAAPARIPR